MITVLPPLRTKKIAGSAPFDVFISKATKLCFKTAQFPSLIPDILASQVSTLEILVKIEVENIALKALHEVVVLHNSIFQQTLSRRICGSLSSEEVSVPRLQTIFNLRNG